MKVGLVLPQSPDDGSGGTWREILEMARLAESGGADSVWVCDHFLYRPADRPQVGYHEAWTLVSALAAATERVEIGTLVLATSFRPPGLLAKMAATANDIAAGRLILGLGCGWYEAEYTAFGYPFDHRVARFEEALEIIARLLRGETVTFAGRWYQLQEAVILPAPSHETRIMVAAGRPRMLRATARFADQWQEAWFGLPNDKYREVRAAFEDACAAEGRDPSTIELTVGVNVGRDAPPERQLPLDPAAIADGLNAWAELGIGHVQLGVDPMTPAGFEVALEGIRRFKAG
ncbi:MAG TPA: LLM class flavin-dependent oxidoreductase [Candidatus Limnocylindrales bacterium]|nr:LLM class flavin-dependent oxidoreductase [Candidatus Limnocylindrales bacterium]